MKPVHDLVFRRLLTVAFFIIAAISIVPSAHAGDLDALVDHWELEEEIYAAGTYREYLFEESTYDGHGPLGYHEVGTLLFDETLIPNAFNNNALFDLDESSALLSSSYSYSHSLLAPEPNVNNALIAVPVGDLVEFELEVHVKKLGATDTLFLFLNSQPFMWNDATGPKEFELEFNIGSSELLSLGVFFANAGIRNPDGSLDLGQVDVVLTSQSGTPFILKKSEFELEYTAGGGSTTAIPEPATAVLLATGLGSTLAYRSRRRKGHGNK